MSKIDVALFAQGISADLLRFMENAAAEQKLKSEAISAYSELLVMAMRGEGEEVGRHTAPGCLTVMPSPRPAEPVEHWAIPAGAVPLKRHVTGAEATSVADFSDAERTS